MLDLAAILEWTQLSIHMLVLHSVSIVATALLILFVPKLLAFFRGGQAPVFQVIGIRICLALYLAFELIDIFLFHAAEEYDRVLYRGALSILTFFVASFSLNLFSRWATKRFGIQKKIDDKQVTLASYNSRLTGILFTIFIAITVVYLLLKIWDLQSELQSTGFVGVIAAFVLFTSPIWLPDVYYGLIVLSSDMLSDGHAIRFGDQGAVYVIYRVSFVYTILLNVETNNRTVIRNSKLFENKVENLTKRASVEGLRQSLVLKVSYPVFAPGNTDDETSRAKAHEKMESFYKRLESMFEKTQQVVRDNHPDSLAENAGFEWGIINTGDYALEVVLYYHLAALPDTMLTKKLRGYLYRSRQVITRAVYTQAVLHGIELCTPALMQIDKAALPPIQSS